MKAPNNPARFRKQDGGKGIPADSEYLRAVQASHAKTKRRPVPKDGVTFGPAKKAGSPAKIIVWHPPTGTLHHIQFEGDLRQVHESLARHGYLHPHPRGAQIWAKMFASATTHAGRKIHVLHRNGFFVDGEHVNPDGSKPVPESGVTFGSPADDSARKTTSEHMPCLSCWWRTDGSSERVNHGSKRRGAKGDDSTTSVEKNGRLVTDSKLKAKILKEVGE